MLPTPELLPCCEARAQHRSLEGRLALPSGMLLEWAHRPECSALQVREEECDQWLTQ
jgi:hypothetical protein